MQVKFVSLTAYDVLTYDVTNKHEEAQLLTFLSELRSLSSQCRPDLHATVTEFVKNADTEALQKGWTAAAQQAIMEETKGIVQARRAEIYGTDSDEYDAYDEDDKDDTDEEATGSYNECRNVPVGWADFGSLKSKYVDRKYDEDEDEDHDDEDGDDDEYEGEGEGEGDDDDDDGEIDDDDDEIKDDDDEQGTNDDNNDRNDDDDDTDDGDGDDHAHDAESGPGGTDNIHAP